LYSSLKSKHLRKKLKQWKITVGERSNHPSATNCLWREDKNKCRKLAEEKSSQPWEEEMYRFRKLLHWESSPQVHSFQGKQRGIHSPAEARGICKIN
jgi:hypothetical protein